MLHAKFLDKNIKGFYSIWAWRPSWSCNLDHLYKLLFPLPKEAFGLVIVKRPGKNLFSHVGMEQRHCFLGIYQYFGELKVSCSRTLHSRGGVKTRGPMVL